MQNSNQDLLAAFLEFHVPLQSADLRKRGIEPFSDTFYRELEECAQSVREKGDTILYRTSETAKNVSRLSKGIALLLLVHEEIELFGLKFNRVNQV